MFGDLIMTKVLSIYLTKSFGWIFSSVTFFMVCIIASAKRPDMSDAVGSSLI